MNRFLSITFFAFAVTLAAHAQTAGPPSKDPPGDIPEGVLTEEDQERLEKFESTREEAFADVEADTEATPEDRKALAEAVAGDPRPIDRLKIRGDWRCRTIKLGGAPVLTVYPWFKCAIFDEGEHVYLRKLTGSQRTMGKLVADGEERLLYAGAGTVNDDPPLVYGESADANEVGYLFARAKNRLTLELPLPKYESKFDIIVLQRK